MREKSEINLLSIRPVPVPVPGPVKDNGNFRVTWKELGNAYSLDSFLGVIYEVNGTSGMESTSVPRYVRPSVTYYSDHVNCLSDFHEIQCRRSYKAVS